MRKSFLLLLTLALLGDSLLAAGAEPPAATDSLALFKQLDANGDGHLLADEIPADKRSLFDRLVRLGDGDADGKLSADEFAAGLKGGTPQLEAPAKPGAAKQPAKARPGRPGKAARPEPGRLFAVLDANGDGQVTLDEIPENRKPRFEKLIARADQDGDQALSREEFTRALPMQMASAVSTPPAEESPQTVKPESDSPQKPKQKKAKQKKAGKNNPAPSTDGARGLFRTLDTDGDGQLSSGEIEGAPAALTRLDANGDGKLSPREVGPPLKQKKKKQP